MSTLTVPTGTKPKPLTGEDEIAFECLKCGGTGFFCMGTENGRPFSLTGFDCYPCAGTGWMVESVEKHEARERRQARAEAKADEEREERALARAMEMAEIDGIIENLLPRAVAIYGELKQSTDAQVNVGEFILRAKQFVEDQTRGEDVRCGNRQLAGKMFRRAIAGRSDTPETAVTVPWRFAAGQD